MTRFTPPSKPDLKDKVVVMTGGASGIGAATVKLLHSLGARVVFGDMDDTGAKETLSAISTPSTVHFLHTDVRSYADNLALFKLALEKYGRVDHAIANAGLVEQGGWFDPRMGIEGVEKEPSTTVLDVNLTGVLYFANIACTYLAHGNKEKKEDKSLTLLSSVAGFKESPGLFVYQASKHGVLGLMRALRLFVPQVFPGVRVNSVNPSFVETRMVKGIRQGWVDAGLPINQPEDLANVLVGICGAGPGSGRGIWEDGDSGEKEGRGKSAGGIKWEDEQAGLNGRAIYVCGGECWDIEEGLDRTEHLWLGKGPSETMTRAQAGLGDGTSWVT